MGDAFLAQSARGRGARWHYAVGLVLILVAWFVAAGALYFALWSRTTLLAAGGALTPWSRDYLEINIAFVPLAPVTLLAIAAWHRRPMRSLVTGAARVAWGRLALGFLAACVLFAIIVLIGGDDPEHPGTRAALLACLPLIVIFTPLQSAGEELLFRGYVMQASAAFTRSRIAIVVFNGALFAALHAYNPAAQVNVLALGGYFLSGAGLALVALRDDGLELPIGGHVANNLVSFMALAYTQQPLASEAEGYDPVAHYVTSLLPVLLLLAIAWLRPRRPEPPMKEPSSPGAS
jgi:membrane protease YdiL (CAAX protease family)